jgi:mRNA interferase MazF
VLILTRESALGYLGTATVAFVTSSRRGVPSEVPLGVADGMKGDCAVNLHNLHTVPQSKLGRRVAQLPPDRMKQVCTALRFAMGCDEEEG